MFTIHTPVAAGNERFDADLVRRVAGPLLDGDGRPNTGGVPDRARSSSSGWASRTTRRQFDMTAFSLRLTHGANAVSASSTRETANATWQGISPHDILGITNGVHPPDLGRPADARAARAVTRRRPRHDGRQGRRRAVSGSASTRSPRDELWEAHQRQKLELAIFARGRLRSQFARHGEAPTTLEELEDVLDPSILTIGFARRFATYKRAAPAVHRHRAPGAPAVGRGAAGPDHLRRQGAPRRPARPGRHPGHLRPSRSPKLRGRVFILEDYDIRIARFLVQGVDVWLNNPRRPLEASGTSGMKAAANGVVNVSVLDGWWDEGWTGDNGWAIGGRETNPDEGAQDWADAQDLYRILEEELVPRLLRPRRARACPRAGSS